ncbi:Ubiquitin carboxyl-terminal hydrolase 19 [Hordeum vulgare]|nr:Ubiquitin carboxyl-terminal hydrolase 19 [Hordeum vulgare]
MPLQGDQQPPPSSPRPEGQLQAAPPELGPCAQCGAAGTKKCSGCKRMRYCSGECQSKHWQSDHKFKCKQMKLLDSADKLPCGVEANSKKSSVYGRISLVPGHRKLNKVIYPYDDFLKLYNWKYNDWKYGEFLPCGLVNCGNSCFANVVLQCLSYTRPLVAYLLEKDHTRQCTIRHEDWCFLCELQSHIQKAIDSVHAFAPMNILSRLRNIGGNLGFGRQEDAHEFMRFAIDKMQSACLDEYGGEKVVDHSTQETTVIQHIFGGRLQSQVQCTACGMVSNRYENMMDLTVEIHGDAESLEKCLDQFTAVEWLDGDNKYKCDGCNDYVKARKHLTVHQAPNILTITLKRFQSGRFGKLNKKVTFPTTLDLTPYMSTTDGTDQYDLYAVVVHLDMLNASFFGHYICYIKHHRGCWLKIDDCKVMAVDEEEVHAQGAYMLLYSRRTPRPVPLLAVKEPIKHEKQCKVPPLNGQNHLIPEDVPLKCESFSKPSEDLREGSESSNDSVHRMDTVEQVSDLDLHMNIERDKLITNGTMHQPISSALHVLEEDTRDPGSLLEGNNTMRADQYGNSACESSLVNSSEEECKEPAPGIDSVDYMDIDMEAGTEVERRNVQQQPVLSDSVGVIGNKSSVPTFENCMSGKPKPLFSLGFLDKPSRKKSDSREECQNGGSMAVSSQKINGHRNEHLSRPEQGLIANSHGGRPSSANGSVHCNGGMFVTPSNGVLVNGDTQSGNYSLDAAKRDVPSVQGFSPRPYRSPSSSNLNQNNTSKGDMSFFPRGFLARPRSGEKAVKGDDGLPFSNGNGKPSSSSVNGNSISNTNSSPRSSPGGMGMSPGFLAKRSRESAAASFVGDPQTSNTSKEQEHVGAAAPLPYKIQERRSSYCTTNGIVAQQEAASNVSGHSDENGHAFVGTKNGIHGEENGSNGTLDMHGSSCQMDDDTVIGRHVENGHGVLDIKDVIFREQNGSNGTLGTHSSSCQMDGMAVTLVSENGMGSEDADHVVKSPAAPAHDGLRRRLTTSKYFDESSMEEH